MNVNGTLINYYIHCPRQCYLFGNRINLEDNSETGLTVTKVVFEWHYIIMFMWFWQ